MKIRPKTMLSLTSSAETIYHELVNALDSVGMRWKASDNLSEYSEVKPSVHLFTYDIDTEIPSPSVLIQVVSLSQSVAHLAIYIHVTHPAVMDKEVTYRTEDNTWVYRDGTEFTSHGVRSELYRASLSLGEVVYTEMNRLSKSGYAISSVSLTPPDPIMGEFPYCSCLVECDMKIHQDMSTNTSRLMELL